MKRRLIPKGTKIEGEGKGYPYEVIADLPQTMKPKEDKHLEKKESK